MFGDVGGVAPFVLQFLVENAVAVPMPEEEEPENGTAEEGETESIEGTAEPQSEQQKERNKA